VTEDPALAEARRKAAAARERLVGNAHALQERLNPSLIAGNLWADVRQRSGAMATDAARVATKRPLATSLVAAGLAALIFRKPLASLVTRLRTPTERSATPTRRPRRRNGDHR